MTFVTDLAQIITAIGVLSISWQTWSIRKLAVNDRGRVKRKPLVLEVVLTAMPSHPGWMRE